MASALVLASLGRRPAPVGSVDARDYSSPGDAVMSKMDNLRAMREARYEAAQKAAKKPGGSAVRPAKAAPVAPKKTSSSAAESTPADAEAPTEALCGHRSMNGRTCTREQGHSAKNHRYN